MEQELKKATYAPLEGLYELEPTALARFDKLADCIKLTIRRRQMDLEDMPEAFENIQGYIGRMARTHKNYCKFIKARNRAVRELCYEF